MPKHMVKIKIPLPENDPSGGAAEWLWAEHTADGKFLLQNVPIFAFGLSLGDIVEARIEDGALVFTGISKRGGHSTYRLYTKQNRHDPVVQNLVNKLINMKVYIENATDKIVGVDVLPEADIFKVYETLEKAEQDGLIDFEEGYCGHTIHKN